MGCCRAAGAGPKTSVSTSSSSSALIGAGALWLESPCCCRKGATSALVARRRAREGVLGAEFGRSDVGVGGRVGVIEADRSRTLARTEDARGGVPT